jgi:hypothetical protein
LEHCCIWLRDLDTKKIRAKIFGEVGNVVLEKNREDKMVIAKIRDWMNVMKRNPFWFETTDNLGM